MKWQPIETAPKDGEKILAREGKGEPEYWTWWYFDGWCHVVYREPEECAGYLCEEWWEPKEWKSGGCQ